MIAVADFPGMSRFCEMCRARFHDMKMCWLIKFTTRYWDYLYDRSCNNFQELLNVFLEYGQNRLCRTIYTIIFVGIL